LKQAGVKTESIVKEENNILSGLTFCVTGTLKQFSREEIKNYIESLGGHFTDNLTKKTNYLIVGDNPGSKLDKAVKFGVATIREEEFLKMTQERGA